LIQRLDHSIGVAIYGSIQNISSMYIAIRGHIRAATSEAKAKWGASANNHLFFLHLISLYV
jgi:hypothetical protein